MERRSTSYEDLVCQSAFLWQTYTGIARAEAENGAPHGDIFSWRSQLEVSCSERCSSMRWMIFAGRLRPDCHGS